MWYDMSDLQLLFWVECGVEWLVGVVFVIGIPQQKRAVGFRWVHTIFQIERLAGSGGWACCIVMASRKKIKGQSRKAAKARGPLLSFCFCYSSYASSNQMGAPHGWDSTEYPHGHDCNKFIETVVEAFYRCKKQMRIVVEQPYLLRKTFSLTWGMTFGVDRSIGIY